MDRVCDFLKQVKTYTLITLDGDRPCARPFGTAHIIDGRLCVQTASTKEVSKQLHSNPHAEICCYVGGKWMRLSAEMVLDDRREARAAMLEAYPNLRNRGYDEDDGITEIWYLKNATARIYVFNDLTETITF